MARRAKAGCGCGVLIAGTTYHDDTDPRVIEILEQAKKTRRRICVYYGDPKTGRDWGDQAACGYVSRTAGGKKVKVPTIVNKTQRYRTHKTATDMSEQLIVKIIEPGIRTPTASLQYSLGKVLYQHPNYKLPPGRIS